MYEVAFRIKHDGCPFSDITRKHMHGTIIQWCNAKTDVFEVKSRQAQELSEIVREIKEIASDVGGMKVRAKKFEPNDYSLVLQAARVGCICRQAFKARRIKSVSDIIRKNRSVEIPPTVYREGWEYYNVLSFNPSDFKNLFRDVDTVGESEIISKKTREGTIQDSFTISLRNLFSRLTGKQLQAFIEAFEAGYYVVPRRTTIGKIAKQRRVSRTTYDDHLRKAESKIVLAIAPYLRLYSATLT